jgi:hypothetical protein
MTNFFIRHWRGDYSLARSFWLHGAATGLLTLDIYPMVIGPIAGLNFDDENIKNGLLIAVLFMPPLILIWLSVGIWRSANHAKQAGRKFWPVVAQSWLIGFSLAAAMGAILLLVMGS